jgi:CRISPR-associated endonuclease Cas2
MHLISYDIGNDRLRLKAANALLRMGLHRLQYSVFMGELGEAALKHLEAELAALALEKAWVGASDSILILPLHQYSEDLIQFIGKAPERWDEMTGQAHTIMI